MGMTWTIHLNTRTTSISPTIFWTSSDNFGDPQDHRAWKLRDPQDQDGTTNNSVKRPMCWTTHPVKIKKPTGRYRPRQMVDINFMVVKSASPTNPEKGPVGKRKITWCRSSELWSKRWWQINFAWPLSDLEYFFNTL